MSRSIARQGREPGRSNPAEGAELGIRSGGFHEGNRFPLNAETGRIPVDMFHGRKAANVEELLTMIAETKNERELEAILQANGALVREIELAERQAAAKGQAEIDNLFDSSEIGQALQRMKVRPGEKVIR